MEKASAVGCIYAGCVICFHHQKGGMHMKRTKLSARALPRYSRGEEAMNMITHIAGGGFAVIALTLSLVRAILRGTASGIWSAGLYGSCMVLVYTISSIYHGLRPGTGKKVLQILDHCAIYLLISGTYTPILVCAMAPVYPAIGWGLLAVQWVLAVTATVLTAIDLRKYRVFSMLCYIGLGWGIAPFLPQAWEVLGGVGFAFLLSGGISYTVGAVLFGLGKKVKWMHSLFHIFVVLGSMLQWVTIHFYVL